MTWFILSYFVGVFGFPYLGGWIVEEFGSKALITVIVFAGLVELVLGAFHNRRRAAAAETSLRFVKSPQSGLGNCRPVSERRRRS